MIKLARARARDAQVLAAIARLAYTDEAQRFDPANRGEESTHPTVGIVLANIEYKLYFKILLKDEVIGGLYIDVIGQGHYQIEDFCIHPRHQSKGYGKQVLKLIEEMHPQAKIWTLATPSYSVRNQHLYETMGYRKMGREQFEGIEIIRYKKRIF